MKNRHHFIGIGGIGMSALAGILLEQGLAVSGSDLKKSEITEKLEELGGVIFYDHNKDNILDDVEEVVVSSAIHPDNPELNEAKNRCLKIVRRAEKLAEIMKEKKAICVAGAHGKTTTTGMLYCVLEEADLFPSVVVGGILNNIMGNYKLDKGDFFVAEADESDKSFLLLSPYASIITNIEDDHLENYGSIENIINAFELFLASTLNKKLTALCIDNIYLKEIIKKIPEALSYSLSDEKADFYARNVGYSGIGICGDIYHKEDLLGRLELRIPGKHNLQNAIGVAALSLRLGISFEDIRNAFLKFYGVNRRFQILYAGDKITVVDDYAHHPSEIKATLKAAREAHKGRIILVFQPHRYSRTHQLLEEFAASFSEADKVVLLPIYSAGEYETYDVNTEKIIELMSLEDKDKTVFIGDFDKALEYLKKNTENNDLVITMGAGDVYKIGEDFAGRLKKS